MARTDIATTTFVWREEADAIRRAENRLKLTPWKGRPSPQACQTYKKRTGKQKLAARSAGHRACSASRHSAQASVIRTTGLLAIQSELRDGVSGAGLAGDDAYFRCSASACWTNPIL